jgi:hypothetical protein
LKEIKRIMEARCEGEERLPNGLLNIDENLRLGVAKASADGEQCVPIVRFLEQLHREEEVKR